MSRAATVAKLRRLAADPSATDNERQVAAEKADTLEAAMPPAPPRPPTAVAAPHFGDLFGFYYGSSVTGTTNVSFTHIIITVA